MTIGNKDLFVGFLKIGMMGFGGVAPVARHVIVEDRRWMDDKEYAALLGFGQLLPGANVTNMAILLGMRHGGFLGVLAAMGGMLAVPLLVLMAVSTAYSHAASHARRNSTGWASLSPVLDSSPSPVFICR